MYPFFYIKNIHEIKINDSIEKYTTSVLIKSLNIAFSSLKFHKGYLKIDQPLVTTCVFNLAAKIYY